MVVKAQGKYVKEKRKGLGMPAFKGSFEGEKLAEEIEKGFLAG